ncbi:DUF6053 domain-containing protein, partial [Lysobacter sp. 2RAB21]
MEQKSFEVCVGGATAPMLFAQALSKSTAILNKSIGAEAPPT